MTAYEHLFYGLGHILYSISLADGAVQREEMEKVKEIVDNKLENHKVEFDVMGIIFQLIEDESVFNMEDAYKIGMKNIRLGDHYLTPELKDSFKEIADEVLDAFDEFSQQEVDILNRFKKDISEL